MSSQPSNTLQYPNLSQHCSSTYEALSYVVEAILIGASRKSLSNVSEEELGHLLIVLEQQHQVDLSQLSGFPLDAPDVEETLVLLARLQNRAALGTTTTTTCSSSSNHLPLCTIQDITAWTLLDRSHKTHRYDIGEWVEVRGPSMRYRMETIYNILRSRHDDDTVVVYYETMVDHKLTLSDLRWPKEALQRIFGMGPWAWQQWALLKLEDTLTLKRGHPHDLEVFDIRGYVEDLWQVWLQDKRNAEFRHLFERVGASGQQELVDHILSPFLLIVEVIHDDDKWDFADADVSIFTYVSLLGSGFFDGLVVFLIQVSIPIILFFYYTRNREADDDIATGTREMLFVVLVYYLYKIARDTASDFHQLTGHSSSTISKIQSLRTVVWENGNDSVAQSLGYTVDLFMNSGYICYLYIFNIWILFNVRDPFELLGSVIFFEFLFGLDEEIASSRWWDTGTKRFLKAGVVGNILQINIGREYCNSSENYLRKYGAIYNVEEQRLLKRRFDEKGLLNTAGFLRKYEDLDSKLLTVTERVERLRRNESNSTKYRKPKPVRFSIISSDKAIFERHQDLCDWSQWEELIFLFPTPKLVPANYRAGTKLKIDGPTGRQPVIHKKRDYAPGTTRRWRFIRHMCDVLSCRSCANSYRAASEFLPWSYYATRTFHGILAWQSYFLQLVFPFFTLVAIVLVYYEGGYCQLHLGDCVFETYEFNLLLDTVDL